MKKQVDDSSFTTPWGTTPASGQIPCQRGIPLRGVPRLQIDGDVRFSVVNLSTGKTVLSDEIEAFTSYTDEGDLRLPQERDAEERLMQILADQFVTRLTMHSAKIAASLE